MELKERVRREEVLKKYGLIKGSNYTSESKVEEAEDYGDDFEEPSSTARSKGGGESKDGGGDGSTQCAFVRWSIDDRKLGLKYIMDFTKDARQEQLIKTLMSNGSPPQPPRLWASPLTDSYFGGEDDAMTTEFLLRWGPDQQADLVSFYSLEFAGAVGTGVLGKGDEYRVIFTDPEDASPDSAMSLRYAVGNLQPGTTYMFRVRGFNGFGAGEFTYKQFSTRPIAPVVPRIIKLSSDAVTLRWTFTPAFFKCLEELKKMFSNADSDKSGQVDREELSAALTEKAEASKTIQSFLKKIQKSLGVSFDDGYDALFDMIEGDDDNKLSWYELGQLLTRNCNNLTRIFNLGTNSSTSF